MAFRVLYPVFLYSIFRLNCNPRAKRAFTAILGKKVGDDGPHLTECRQIFPRVLKIDLLMLASLGDFSKVFYNFISLLIELLKALSINIKLFNVLVLYGISTF